MEIAERPRRVAVRAAQLFDVTTGAMRAAPMVLLDGATIGVVDFGVAPPPDAEVHDLGDATLLPGLVDPHVHLAFDASPDPVGALAARDDAEVVEAMTVAARNALLGGVTTVRDLGDRDYLSLALRGRADLPTILCAGPPLTLTDGHCHYLGGAVGPGVDSARAAVRGHIERGVDVIKVMASGGNLTPSTFQHEPQFTVDELRAVVDEAHRHDLRVTAHAHATAAIANALAAGVDCMEHVTFWTIDSIETPLPLIEQIVASRIAVSATIGLMPSADGAGPPPAVAARLPKMIANTRLLFESGADVIVGTDGGVGPPKPHDVLRYAMPMMVDVGIPGARALQMITSSAAHACGRGDSKGRLAAGFDADVLAVGGDPITDPGALHDIRAVYARGTRVR